MEGKAEGHMRYRNKGLCGAESKVNLVLVKFTTKSFTKHKEQCGFLFIYLFILIVDTLQLTWPKKNGEHFKK
jgi:hypothetical protein